MLIPRFRLQQVRCFEIQSRSPVILKTLKHVRRIQVSHVAVTLPKFAFVVKVFPPSQIYTTQFVCNEHSARMDIYGTEVQLGTRWHSGYEGGGLDEGCGYFMARS